MTKKNDITLPTPEDERLLNDVLEDSVDYVEVRGKKYGISWLKRGTIRKFTSTMQKSGNDDKISCQCAAAIILNGYWKIKFFYPFLWRWFFYIKQYGDHELMKVIAVGKKKIPVEDYLTATIYLTAMKDTMMTMTKEEAEHILHEQTWEIGKSYPWLTEPLRVFGIPISKPLFGIYWVLTNAQIELLAMDVSIVVTDCDKDNKEKKHDTKNFKSPSVSEIEDAAKRWKDKYGNGETAININDYK